MLLMLLFHLYQDLDFQVRPSRPIGPRKMASIFNSLMTDVLGYKTYLAQGGDFGGTIATWLAYDFPKDIIRNTY